MSRIHRKVPPAGSKIGIAFSGGLDTRCAVAWLARQDLNVYAYTADLAQPDEETPVGHPAGRAATWRQGRAPHRLPRRPGARGADRHPVRRVPPRRGRAQVLQHHAARPRGDHHRHRARHERGRRRHLQRRQHPQGERHPALLPLRRADQPGAHHLQAVARPGVRDRLRRPHRDERVPGGDQAAVPHGRREGLQHRRQLPGRHARGEGPGVPGQGDPDREPDHGRRLLEAGGARRAGGGHRRLRAGAAGQPERQALSRRASSSSRLATSPAAATASA